jgi:type II secretory pathway pseudopilin PulG
MNMMKRARTGQEGSAMLLATIISLVVMGIAGAYLVVSQFTQRNTTNAMFGAQALYAAEAGASAYISALNANVKDPKYPKPSTSTFPTSYNRAAYAITDDPTYLGGSFRRLVVSGTYANVTRRIEVILTNNPGGVYWNAIFAGNRPPGGAPADPYMLTLSGSGSAVDKVLGDIYSGGDFKAQNNAILADESGAEGKSTVMTAGTADTGTLANYISGLQENLHLPRDGKERSIWEQKAELLRTGTRMDTDGTTFIDVKHDLTTKGSYSKWGAEGSYATQITKSDEPAHIFRMDPTSTDGTNNRTSKYEYTPPASGRSDFYIEDPTVAKLNTNTLSVPVNGDSKATSINVSESGNNAVYFVDGNLRVSGEPVKSYQFKSSNGAPLSMTMVVKGNISLTDNILYQTYMSKSDGVAFIAITDPDYPNVTADVFEKGGALPTAYGKTVDDFVVEFNKRAASAGNDTTGQPKIKQLDFKANPGDYERAAQEYNKAYGSGNVFFGDPGSGTVEHFEGFMYAENNFYATNLDSTKASGGTQNIEIWGNMTAGNQVKIVRDTTKAGYIPLKVTFDPLIKGGSAGKPPPALPSTPGFAESEYGIASWKQIP